MLCKLSALKRKQAYPIGVDIDTLRDNVQELVIESEDMVKRFFIVANVSKSGVLTWDEFLIAINNLTTRELKTKTDMFFQMIDRDGNGYFDYEEIFEICKLSFGKHKTDEDLELVNELAEYFTRFIFEAFKTPMTDLIPMEKIKEQLTPDSEHVMLLAMFCGAE